MNEEVGKLCNLFWFNKEMFRVISHESKNAAKDVIQREFKVLAEIVKQTMAAAGLVVEHLKSVLDVSEIDLQYHKSDYFGEIFIPLLTAQGDFYNFLLKVEKYAFINGDGYENVLKSDYLEYFLYHHPLNNMADIEILIDNKSIDTMRELIEKYASQHPEFVFLQMLKNKL